MIDRGFEEMEHMADWAMHVWAPDLPVLLAEAARGMYSLMGVSLRQDGRVRREVALQAEDAESLLVSFLSELLFYCEQEFLAFDQLEIRMEGTGLRAWLEGARVASQQKEIKAITFHNLAIRSTPAGLDVTVVLDV